jgi:proteasome lid subunit RPN8/RPN11
VYLFTDYLINEIAAEITAFPPERGAALLGPPATPLISRFLPNEQAKATGASYIPSTDLVVRVAETERTEGLQFKGVIHSHPGSFDRPSRPDRHAFRHGLDLNPRMAASYTLTTLPPSL